jgi:uncharacterized protein (TIGR02147 family)
LEDFYDRTPALIASRLGLTVEDVESHLHHLAQYGLIRYDADKKTYFNSGLFYTTSDGVPSSVLQRAHLRDLQKAGQTLTQEPVQKRDFTSITFAGNSQEMEKVKKEIRKFHDRICTMMEKGDKNNVYKLSVQLYPLTVEE